MNLQQFRERTKISKLTKIVFVNINPFERKEFISLLVLK